MRAKKHLKIEEILGRTAATLRQGRKDILCFLLYLLKEYGPL